MAFEPLVWYCRPVENGKWAKSVENAFGAYTPCGIVSIVLDISYLVLFGCCFYRIWRTTKDYTVQRYRLRSPYFNYFLGVLAFYCTAEPLIRLFMGLSIANLDGQTSLAPFEVVSLIVEAVAWFCMLTMIALETKIYIHEFRWYVRFVVIYVLVGDVAAFNDFLLLRDYYNKLVLIIFTSGIICQLLFGILFVFYVPNLGPYPGYTPIRGDVYVDNTEYEFLPGGEQICPERHVNIFSKIFFSWMTPLMQLGYKRPITEKDVWKLDSWDETETLNSRFQKFWVEESQRSKPWLLRALHRSLGGRSETIEFILCGSLFPPDLTIRDRVKHWIKVFSTFDKVEVKALEQILLQKQRLQQEFQKYLTLRQTHQDNVPEIQKRLSGFFRIMSRMFHDAAKAEEGFHMLNQLKDQNIWKLMRILLDPGTGFCQAWSCRDELLKILGERHSLYDFMDMLSVKCSYLFFNKELVKEIILESTEQRSSGDAKFILSCMDLLTVIASFSPHLFIGCEDDLMHLLKEDNDIIKEGITRVLAKAGGTIREQLAMTSSPVDLVLERLCLEGTRKQAKYSVHAIAAITKDDGLKSLSVLYKRLVDMLEEKTHLPSILQSLGCIAQIAMPVFETREDEIVEFISKKVLKRSNDMPASLDSIDWNEKTELCSLKMLGIKTLVKSYLPVKDAPSRTGIDKLMALLRNVLAYGDISKDVESSAVDKAHMRLTAAKSVLRLSRLWDHMIPLDIFYITLRISEDVYPQFRTFFINKVHQYIKDRLLDAKYACAFLLNINQYQSPEYKEAKHNLLEVVQICQQLKLRQISMQNDVSSSVMYPESILVYLVHALAHHPSCSNIDDCTELSAFEPIYWRLHLFLSVLLLGDEGWQSGACPDRIKDSYTSVVSIFRSIKCSEDAADCARSRTSHAISDLGLSITKKLVPDQADISEVANTVSLPANLYKASEKDEESSMINGEQSWLSGESALAHFEALMFEDKEQILSDVNKDALLLEEKDNIDNEVPLGKMMKLLKSHGAKKKKAKTQTSNLKSKDEDVDVLGMVREINLDTIKAARSVENSGQKRKRNEATNNMVVATPKRKRSNTIHRSPSSNLDKKQHVSFMESDLLLSSLPKIQSISSRRGKKKGDRSYSGEVAMNDMKNVSITEGSDKKGSGSSAKKRKVRSISGLSKCSSQKTQLNGELVGSVIKVWWPLDKKFYEGVVHSYDPGNKKHSILYDDGDVEVLRLEREKWELIPNGSTPKNRSKSQQSTSHEKLSLDINDDGTNHNSQENNKPTKRSAGSKHGGRHISGKSSQSHFRRPSKNDINAHKGNTDIKYDSEVPDVHPHSGSEIDDVNLEFEAKESSSPVEMDDETKVNTLEMSEELMEKADDVSNLKSMEDSDDEPLSLWRQRAGKTG